MFQIGGVGLKGLDQFANMLGALGPEAPKAINRAINRTGDMAKTQVVRALTKQTGLPAKTIRKAVKVKRGSWSNLAYTLFSAGGDVSLKYFKPRETRSGVSAAVGGQRTVHAKTFMKGGSFSTGRVALKMGGHVFLRMGRRTDLEKQKSGVVIPAEMIEGASAAAFDRAVTDNLPRRLDHEISRALGL